MRPLVPLIALVLLAGCAQPPGDPSATDGSGTGTSGSGPSSSPSSGSGTAGTATTTTASTTTVRPAEWTPSPWVEWRCDMPSLPPGAAPPPPEFVVLDGQGRLTRFGWNDGHATPRMQAGPGIVKVATAGTGVVTADRNGTSWSLVARGMDLHERKRVDVPEVTALASDGKTVFAATRWNLTAYDLELRELGRLPVSPPGAHGPGKAIDAIALHAGHAYLLDDVVGPFWFFRIDVRQPSAMRQVLVHEVSSSTSPTLQWLNASAGTWYVERNFFGMGGGGRSVVPVDVDDGTEGPAITVAGSTYPFQPSDPSPRREQGYTVFDTGFTLPAWAVVGHGNTSLARVDVVDGSIRRSCAKALEGDTHVAAAGLHLLTWGRNHVQLWTLRGGVEAGSEVVLPVAAVGLWPVAGQLP